jgi:hypothetical protein
MMGNLYEEYALLESQEKEIKTKKEQLRPLIMQQMLDKGQKKIETGVGSFSISPLKKWTYPERIVKLEEDFKAEKAKTQSTGEATYVEEPSLRFTIVKL